VTTEAQKRESLHEAIIDALDEAVVDFSDPNERPLALDLVPPNYRRLRLYAYPLVAGTGTKRDGEFKVNVRIPGTKPGEYAAFDYSDGRIPVVIGYHAELDAFVLWDATMKARIKHAGNLQVRVSTVHQAVVDGWAYQLRRCRGTDLREVLIACRSWNLLRALNERILYSGGRPEDQCPV
jgi:hypothetical protein